MEQNEVYMFAIMIPFGLIILGLGAYMYDQLQKETSKYKYDNTVFKPQLVIYTIPFVFLKHSIKNRSTKGIIIAILFWIILLGGWGFMMSLFINSK